MTDKAKLVSPDFDSELDNSEAMRFRDLALRYQEIGALNGVRIIPFRSDNMSIFYEATAEERKKATDFLESIVTIHEETISAKETPIKTRQLVWRALRKFSLVPSADIFDFITEEDAVVIYNNTHGAIFWNLQFFNYTSFSIEEMFFGKWFKSTKRDPAIQEALYKMSIDVLSGNMRGTFVTGVPPHVVEEIDTIDCMKTMMELPYGSILTSEGQIAGMMMVQRMKVIG